MSLQCITPTIGLVADQTPDHFVSVSIVSLHSYGCHPSYDHWIIVTTTTTTTTTTNHHHHHHHHHPFPLHGGPLFPDCTFTVSSLYPTVPQLNHHCIITVPHCTLTVYPLYPPRTLTVSHFTPTEPSLYPNCAPMYPHCTPLYSHCIPTVSSLYPQCILLPSSSSPSPPPS